MIIECADCTTRFRVPVEKVGMTGKKVRCSKCGAVFYAYGEPPMQAAYTAKTRLSELDVRRAIAAGPDAAFPRISTLPLGSMTTEGPAAADLPPTTSGPAHPGPATPRLSPVGFGPSAGVDAPTVQAVPLGTTEIGAVSGPGREVPPATNDSAGALREEHPVPAKSEHSRGPVVFDEDSFVSVDIPGAETTQSGGPLLSDEPISASLDSAGHSELETDDASDFESNATAMYPSHTSPGDLMANEGENAASAPVGFSESDYVNANLDGEGKSRPEVAVTPRPEFQHRPRLPKTRTPAALGFVFSTAQAMLFVGVLGLAAFQAYAGNWSALLDGRFVDVFSSDEQLKGAPGWTVVDVRTQQRPSAHLDELTVVTGTLRHDGADAIPPQKLVLSVKDAVSEAWVGKVIDPADLDSATSVADIRVAAVPSPVRPDGFKNGTPFFAVFISAELGAQVTFRAE